MTAHPLKALTISMLYPNPVQIRHGIFVRERLSKWLQHAGGSATVVAPVPWFPFDHSRFGRRPELSDVPAEERDGDVTVLHPRFLSIPLVGRITNPWAYYRAVRSLWDRVGDKDVQVIDAHFGFPDGVAAVLLGKALGLPVVITVRGSDINIMTQDPFVRVWVRWALRRCASVIAVSEPLAARVRALCGDDVAVSVLTNGVDGDRFRIAPGRTPRSSTRRPTVLSVGNLIELKGHHLVIEALAQLPDASLTIVGRGPYQQRLHGLVEEKGLSGRVTIEAELSQGELIERYNAADVLVLASRHEGMPNVVLESLSCGTPVVATAVGGVPDVLTSPEQGRLVEERTPAAIAAAIREVLADDEMTPERVRRSVEGFSWNATVDGVQSLFESVVERHRGG